MSKRERREKAEADDAKLILSSRVKSRLVAEVEKLLDLGLWIETDHPVSHRFGEVGVSFYLGDKKWRVAGRRALKDGQYLGELFYDHKGIFRHADIPMSRYVSEQKDFYEKDG